MQSALDQFRISINRVRELIGLYSSLDAISSSSLDSSDMLRAALVLAVSALDYYVHEVVTLGMLEIYQGIRAEPQPSANTTQSAFSRFQVSLGGVQQERSLIMEPKSWLESEIHQIEGYDFLQQTRTISELIPVISESLTRRLNKTAWLESEIRERLSYQSFQQPDKIANAIRCISQKRDPSRSSAKAATTTSTGLAT